MASKVHVAVAGAGKWHLGKAACGCTISRYTPTSDDPKEVTCPRCLKRIPALKAERIAELEAGMRKVEADILTSPRYGPDDIERVLNLWREKIRTIRETW